MHPTGVRSSIDLWRVDLRRHAGLDLLSEGERERARRFLLAAKRLEFTVSRSALRRVLSHRTGAPAEELEFDVGEHGRPRLRGESEMNFNVSHSSGLALIAVGHVDLLGVDVEARREGREFRRLAERFFSALEVGELRASSDPVEELFYRGWTRKEAYLKAWGTGLSFSSRRFSLSLAPGHSRLLETEMPGDDGSGWHFRDVDVGEGHAACICWRGAELDVRLRELPLDWSRE